MLCTDSLEDVAAHPAGNGPQHLSLIGLATVGFCVRSGKSEGRGKSVDGAGSERSGKELTFTSLPHPWSSEANSKNRPK
jgi:hypothetical protein